MTVKHIAAISGLAIFGTSAHAQYCEDVDVVHDGILNVFDISALFSFWGTDDPLADFNNDGLVDGLDLGYQLVHFRDELDSCLPEPFDFGNVSVHVEDVTDVVNPPEGTVAYEVFANLGSETEILINVYDADVGCAGGGCFLGDESFYAIGDGNPAFDPNFDAEAFADGDSFGHLGGWFDLPLGDAPAGLAGLYPDNRVRIARIVLPEGNSITGHVKALIYRPDMPVKLHAAVLHIDVPTNDCYADFNNDGNLNILDYVAFQDAFTSGDFAADCNGCGCLNILQFVCFQNKFVEGCD